MSVSNPEALVLGAYLHFDKFENPIVREYYNSMVRNIVSGLGVKMHRVDNRENLIKLMDSVKLTHLFVGEEEYNTIREYIEPLADNIKVVIVAGKSFKLSAGAKARIMEKPFYCFPVVSVLNTEKNAYDNSETVMYCRNVRALVVDDDPMNLTVAKSIFGKYGMIVTTAYSGQEAIDLCTEKDYDIIFMDHMMPGMDGVEAMKRISIERAKMKSYIPIVALTANAVSSAKEMFLSEGFDGFVSKPIEIVELERVLKNVLPHSMITYETEGADDKDKSIDRYEERIAPAEVPSENEPAEKEKIINRTTNTEIAPEEVKQDTRSFEEKLADIGIDAEKGLRYCMDKELYRTILADYVADSEGKSDKLEEYFGSEDMKNYQILVHALKSTSKMIGADDLSDKARELESAAKESDSFFIKENHRAAMKMYKDLTDALKIILEQAG